MHLLLESCLPYLTWYNHQLYYVDESESGNLLRPKQSYGCFWCLILFENDRQQPRGTKCQPVGLIVLSPTGLYVCVCRVLFTRPYIITSIVKPLKLIICLILDGYQSHDSKTTLWGLTWFRNQPQVFNFVQCFCVFKSAYILFRNPSLFWCNPRVTVVKYLHQCLARNPISL